MDIKTENAKKFQGLLRSVAKGKMGSRDLTREEAEFCLSFVFSEEIHPVQVGGLLTAMRFKGSTDVELNGFLDAVEKHSQKVEADTEKLFTPNVPYDGRKVSLNLSVAASLVTAASGVPVLLHTSTGLTPKKGVTSIHVLEHLGVPSLLDARTVGTRLKETGFGAIHASEFSDGIERLRKWREILLYRSFLHTLEVLQNPGRAKRRLIGAAHDHLAPKFARVAQSRGATHVVVVPGLDGADELPMKKITGYEIKNGKEFELELDPQAFGFSYAEKFSPQDAAETAKITKKVLNNEVSEYKESLVYNAGLRIYIAKDGYTLEQGIKEAKEVLESGKASKFLESIRG